MQTKTNQLMYLSYADVTKLGVTIAYIIDALDRMFGAKRSGKRLWVRGHGRTDVHKNPTAPSKPNGWMKEP